ncbi:MAG: sugar phosphate isomerase/epimerase family protein [Actinomycetota bacterium]
MRLAFSTLACPEWPLERVLAAAAEYGYDGVELRMLDADLVSPAIPGERRRAVRRAFERARVPLCCLDTSFEIADPGAELGEAVAYVELAADLGAPMIRLFGGAPDGEAISATTMRVAGRLARLADHGRELGVTVALETHDSFASGEAAAGVVRDAPPDVGIIWDTLNAFVTGEPAASTFAFVADRLLHVHVKDGGIPPDLERNELFGDGRVPLLDILRMLSSHRYEGWLSVEWEKRWQPSIPDADTALPQYAAALRGALDRLA